MEQSNQSGDYTAPGPVNAVVDDELMAMFKEIAVNDKALLSQQLGEERWVELRSKAHEVKGYAASFGYPAISEKAEVLQDALDQEQMDQVPAFAAALIVEMEQVLP